MLVLDTVVVSIDDDDVVAIILWLGILLLVLLVTVIVVVPVIHRCAENLNCKHMCMAKTFNYKQMILYRNKRWQGSCRTCTSAMPSK